MSNVSRACQAFQKCQGFETSGTSTIKGRNHDFFHAYFFLFQDAVLGVDKDRGNNAQPKKSYVPPHLRGKQGGGGDGERPPPDANGPRRDFNDRGGGRG